VIDLEAHMRDNEKYRRKRRFETQTGAVHKRRNKSDGRAGQRSNKGKPGRAWRKEQEDQE